MTQRIPENFSTVDWSLVTNMGNTIPPRDPNDDEDEDSDTEPDDESEPAVVREPDEDEQGERRRSKGDERTWRGRARRRARRFSHSMTSSSTQCTVESRCRSFTPNKKTAGSTDGPFVDSWG